MTTQIYFAAPLFSEAELRYNASLVEQLENAGHSVFLPQRDGKEVDAYFEQPGVETAEDAMVEIFHTDRDAILESDVLTALLDGQVPDEGVAIEMGIAHERDIPIVGLKTDRRIFAEDEPLNAMIWGVMDEYTESEEEFLDIVDEYSEQYG